MSKHKFYRDGLADNPIPPAKRDTAARQRIIDAYRRDKLLHCATCGYETRHCWSGTAYVCGCGSVFSGKPA
jgi:hypothetical protein